MRSARREVWVNRTFSSFSPCTTSSRLGLGREGGSELLACVLVYECRINHSCTLVFKSCISPREKT